MCPAIAPRNTGARIYAVGDVHGHLGKLKAMHAAIAQDLRDDPAAAPLLVHLGDFVDRGPDSAGCLALLAAGPPIQGVRTINLMGNHEAMLLDALDKPSGQTLQLWLSNGAVPTLESWGINPAAVHPSEWRRLIPEAHLAFLRGLALSHAAHGFVFVHAGVRPGVRLAEQRTMDMLWIRETFLSWEGPMLPEAPETRIVHGHTPSAEPVLRHNRVGVDTGAGVGGPLTCVVLGAAPPRFIQV